MDFATTFWKNVLSEHPELAKPVTAGEKARLDNFVEYLRNTPSWSISEVREQPRARVIATPRGISVDNVDIELPDVDSVKMELDGPRVKISFKFKKANPAK